MKRLLPLIPLLVLSACSRPESTHPGGASLPSLAVGVQPARLEPHVATEEVVGTVRSRLRAMIEAKVTGRVLEYRATPGTMVTAGDLLARVEVPEIQAKVDQAKATLDQAQRDFERQKQLFASSTSTRQEYDAANARVSVAKASVSEAETMMSYARITAPFDGVVTRKLADVGDLATPGRPLLEIEAPTALRFEADLPEAILNRIRMGEKMQVRVASVMEPLEATVSEIAPVADPVSRTFQVKLDLPSTPGLRTGQFGRVSVPVAETKLVIVPKDSVILRGQMELVFVVREGRASLRLVKTGKKLTNGFEILSGLEDGEQVVVRGAAKLVDGQPVTIQP
jgi:membrane fusion protein, multidrug efflux system